MVREVEISLNPCDAQQLECVKLKAAKIAKIAIEDIKYIEIIRRSVDARKRPVIRLKVALYLGTTPTPKPSILEQFNITKSNKKVIVIGAGPAGYFAALELIEQGICPIVVDRGKDVRARRKDLRAIQQFGEVNPHSNYCFGEGGAGTYSDGKLYTRSHKRGSIEKALQLLVEHGAKQDILIDAHPHIGSNKLPKIIANIRATILKYGGEVHFNTFITDFILEQNSVKGVISASGTTFTGDAVILATGHSARDIYQLLYKKGIRMARKPFAIGVRIEHPQALIDEIQYRQNPRDPNLPASSYKLVTQVEGRGVFSFCMCPGGLIVPAATAPDEIVVNGMSMSKRDSPFANSGTVVAVELDDLLPYDVHGVFAGLEFQKAVERKMFKAGDGSQKAPAQRLVDFAEKKHSASLCDTSYIPGLFSAPLHELLPKSIYKRLQKGVVDFGQKMKGYYTNEANVIATESRTSSPIRIPRNKITYMHEDIEGLFPCGEGAGYAGGIISAAMDGQNVAKAITQYLEHKIA